MSHRYLEILDFTQFFKHSVFTPNAENVLEKSIENEILVSVGIELVVVDWSSVKKKYKLNVSFLHLRA